MSLDNIIEKAKDIFETAYRKTGNAVNNQKQRFDISVLESKLKKSYENLGRAYFGMLQNETDFDKESLKPITDDISQKLAQIEEAKSELIKSQNKNKCKKCGEVIDNNSAFCKNCGNRVEPK